MFVFFCIKLLLKCNKLAYKPFQCKCNRLFIFYSKHIYTISIFHRSFLVKSIKQVFYISVFFNFNYNTYTLFRRLIPYVIYFIKHLVFRKRNKVFKKFCLIASHGVGYLCYYKIFASIATVFNLNF